MFSSSLILFIYNNKTPLVQRLSQGNIDNNRMFEIINASNKCFIPQYIQPTLLSMGNCQICMKNESKPPKEQKHSRMRPSDQQECIVNTKPLKPPSPDRRPTNVIANTRSPALQEIKKQITPIKQQATALKILQKIQYRQKYTTTPIETARYSKEIYSSHDRQRQSQRTQDQHEEQSTAMKEESRPKYQGESKTQPRPQRSQDTASQFQLRQAGQSRAGQLDYLRLLKEKEETIKQLRELLELIDRSNTSGFSEQNDRVLLLERRLREYSKQVKVLEIENQCLISVIQNNHVNIPSNKEEILQREIRELRESLTLAEQGNSEQKQQAQRRIAALEADNKELERECDKLLKLMREREGIDKKESPLSSSHSLVSKDRERVTLSKIKEQYNQNLKLAQENFENEYRDCYQNFRKMVEKESSRIDYYMLRIQDLEQALQVHRQPNNIVHHTHPAQPANHPAQTAHFNLPPHQEIQSLLLQKYSKYMRQLDEEKKVNQKLNLELSIAWKSLRELQMRSFNTSQQLNESQHEEISELSIRNTTLKNKIKQLEIANAALKRSLQQLTVLKARQILELEGKVETIVQLYEGRLKSGRAELSQKCQQLQAFKAQAEAREDRMRSEQSQRQHIIQQKITAIIQTFEKEADIYRESLQARTNTISSLQQENQYLRAELESHLNSKEKETDISKLSESERMIESMEGELRIAKGRLQQAEQRLVVADEERKYYQRANAELNSEIDETRETAQAKINILNKENASAFEQLNNKSKELDESLRQNRQLIEAITDKQDRIDLLTQAMVRLEEQNRDQLKQLQHFRETNLKLQGRSFEDELNALKRSIVEFLAKYKEQSSGKDLQNYYTIQALYEAKIDQNVRLQQQVEDLKDSLNKQQREKSRLTERIANLEKNVGIYEQELKERRSLYEALLKEKSRIEKQILLAKRIKDTQTGTAIEKMSGSVGEITGQIDRLVELERTRHSLISKLFIFE